MQSPQQAFSAFRPRKVNSGTPHSREPATRWLVHRPGTFSQVCFGFADNSSIAWQEIHSRILGSSGFGAMKRSAPRHGRPREVLLEPASLWSDHEVIVVSPILKRVVYPWLANSGYLRRRADGGAFCVLTYHGVSPAGYEVGDAQQDDSLVSAENLRSQLQLLKECYQIVSPDEVRDWITGGKELPERAVLLTCDDGVRNVLTDMTPILREEGLSCLFFLLGASAGENFNGLWEEELYRLLQTAPAGKYSLAGLEDGPEMSVELADRAQRRSAWWNLVKGLSQYDQPARADFILSSRIQFGLPEQWNAECTRGEAQRRRFGLLNRHELRQLLDQGMSVGSNTLNHPMLSQQPSELAWQQISDSPALLG